MFTIVVVNCLVVCVAAVVHYEFLYRATSLIPLMSIRHRYRTVFGDIEPIGHMRYLTGIEALTGLVLITRAASFLCFEMPRHWYPHWPGMPGRRP